MYLLLGILHYNQQKIEQCGFFYFLFFWCGFFLFHSTSQFCMSSFYQAGNEMCLGKWKASKEAAHIYLVGFSRSE